MKYETKVSQVAEYVRRGILEGRYQVGDQLRLDALASEAEVSVTPVREALRILETEGYLENAPHHGFRVTSPDPEDLHVVFEIRRMLEGYACFLAANRISDRELVRLEELGNMMRKSLDTNDYDSFRNANIEFHRVIHASSGSTQLSGLINSLWASFPWELLVSHPPRMNLSSLEHEAILDALRSGDPKRAREAMHEHMNGIENYIVELAIHKKPLVGQAQD